MAKVKLERIEKLARTNLINNLRNDLIDAMKMIEKVTDDMGDQGKIIKPYLDQVILTSGDRYKNEQLQRAIEVYNDYMTEVLFTNPEYVKLLQGDIINAFLKASGGHMNSMWKQRNDLISDGKKKSTFFNFGVTATEEVDDEKENQDSEDSE